MDLFIVAFWIVGGICFLIALKKNKKEALESMKKTKGMMKNMIGDIIGIILLIGLILTVIPPESIKTVLGSDNVTFATIASGLAGSITLIPAFVAFPLVGSFVDVGASIIPAVSFLTTLTMVGVVTYPLEKKEFGPKFAVSRNVISFAMAMVIAVVMGVVL